MCATALPRLYDGSPKPSISLYSDFDGFGEPSYT